MHYDKKLFQNIEQLYVCSQGHRKVADAVSTQAEDGHSCYANRFIGYRRLLTIGKPIPAALFKANTWLNCTGCLPT